MLKNKIIKKISEDNYCLNDYVIKSYNCQVISNGVSERKDVIIARKKDVIDFNEHALLYHQATNLLLFNTRDMSSKGYIQLGNKYHEVLGKIGYDILIGYEHNGETIIV